MDRVQRWLPAGFVVALVLVVFLETRLWLVARFPFFLDEGILAQYAQYGQHDPDSRLISLSQGFRPGLVWMTLGGMKLGLQPLTAIRVAAVLFALIGLVCGALVADRYVGRRAAVVFVVLALFTPFLFVYGALGLRDPVIMGVVVAGFLLELELARRPRLAYGLLLGMTFAITIWTKESGKVAMFLLPLSLVYFPFASPQRARLALQWAGNVVLALFMAYAATWPLSLSSYYAQLGTVQHTLGVTRSFTSIRAHPLRYFDDSWPAIHGELTSYLTWPIAVVALVGLVLGLRRRRRFTAVVAVWAIAQILAAIWLARNAYARYLVPAVPFVLLLAAIGVDEVLGMVGQGRRLAIAAAVGIALLVPALVFDAQLSFDAADAPYPPSDKVQFVTSFASGFGVRQAARELQLLTGGQPTVALMDPVDTNEPLEVLASQHGLQISWTWVGRPDARSWDLLVTNGSDPPAGIGRYREVWRYTRPHGGVPLEIYVRTRA